MQDAYEFGYDYPPNISMSVWGISVMYKNAPCPKIMILGFLACTSLFSGCSKEEVSQLAAPVVSFALKKIPMKLIRKANTAAFVVELLVGDDLETPYGSVSLELDKILCDLVSGQSVFSEVKDDTPVLMLVDKQNNKFQCWKLQPFVERIEISSDESQGVKLIVVNSQPLQVELWLDSVDEVLVDIVLKDQVPIDELETN